MLARMDILLVEDSDTQAQMFTEILEDQGYSVHVAGTGALAVADCLQKTPRLLMLDYYLPDMWATECCRQIKERCGNTPPKILVFSSTPGAEEEATALQAGADLFVQKDGKPDTLLDAVNRLIPAS